MGSKVDPKTMVSPNELLYVPGSLKRGRYQVTY